MFDWPKPTVDCSANGRGKKKKKKKKKVSSCGIIVWIRKTN